MRRLVAPLSVVALATILWLIFDGGFANYDTLYALLWGREIADGKSPQMSIPLAPTPHPLLNLVTVLVSPLGTSGETVMMVIAFLSLGWLGYLTYRVAQLSFGVWAGLLAAALILTREPVISFGVRAYVDVPYITFLLAAFVIELRRPRAGTPVLALITLAGLLRPEAWLFAGIYWLYLVYGSGYSPRQLIKLILLVIAAPALWLLTDWLLTGDVLFSFSQTRDSGESLGRVTGFSNIPTTLPSRIGEIVREPVLFGAVVGMILSLLWLRDRSLKLIFAMVISFAAFTLLAASGLPILTRYVLLPAIFLTVFAAGSIFGWRELNSLTYRRERKIWVTAGALAAVLLIAFAPSQFQRLKNTRSSIIFQKQVQADLRSVIDHSDLAENCGPVVVPNHRPVPLIAYWLDKKPSTIISAESGPIHSGYLLEPANRRVARNYIFDRRDQKLASTTPPADFKMISQNRSWKLYRRCMHTGSR